MILSDHENFYRSFFCIDHTWFISSAQDRNYLRFEKVQLGLNDGKKALSGSNSNTPSDDRAANDANATDTFGSFDHTEDQHRKQTQKAHEELQTAMFIRQKIFAEQAMFLETK